MRPSILLTLALGAAGLALGPAMAQAASLIGQPSPVAGFEADDGTELFFPEVATVAVEGLDFFGDLAGFESSFGFYRSSDPLTLTTIFSAADQDTSVDSSDAQLAYIDFLTGQVFDVDDAALESSFVPGMGAIGFFLNIVDTSTTDEVTLYTEAALNTAIGGADAFASFRKSDDPNVYLLGAELPESLGGVILRVDLINGISPIPEPSSEILFAAGLLIVAVAVAARKRSTARS